MGTKGAGMIKSLKNHLGWTLRSSDDEVGTVEDFLFDFQNWVVRYLVVDSGSWLNRRRLIFSPKAVERLADSQDFLVHLTREVIEKSPRFDPQQPMTRQQEMEVSEHYGWPFDFPRVDQSAVPMVEMYSEMREETGQGMRRGVSHLQSLDDVSGYTLEARDGTVGNIQDMLVDDENWRIQYLVVDTGGILGGRSVLLAAQWIEFVDAEGSTVRVDLSAETIQNSPKYEPDMLIDQEYEERLQDHYQRRQD
jgi:uncharacterized protein YrrD